ncbi:uncharacterized protein YecT (DUF1311 family) [Buttiauxella sp. JUb87]|uniref:lysozyme inhibitor LprI family protein n=1 Tax=Buttiauxella sp. JUb87 TaxID=2485129 RepID=UPI00105D60A9|nr:lysozyme inhibitor LprI family protein [Buttiauxella sp. JUb87]TDN47041.1 uncharacterized protein YecT (DUF1311 family) [Buttiauxella sp. JUb87]
MKKILMIILVFPLWAKADSVCDNITVSDQVYTCSKISLEESDASLNNEYKKLLSKVSAEYNSHEELKNEYIKKIKLSQRAWLNFRDKNCEVFSYQIEAGTQAYETSMNSCKDKMTQERTKDLVSIQNQ